MEWGFARSRFAFLASALAASGGFSPRVTWTEEPIKDEDGAIVGTLRTGSLDGPSELDQHPRESAAKFAARNACATYENHLLTACTRFVGFLGRRQPQRQGVDGPLVKLMVENADLRGSSLDAFFRGFALQAKARGSMLLVIDTPDGAPATSLGEQIERRRVPYVRAAEPEAVKDFRIDADSGLFVSITLCAKEWVNDELIDVERDYSTTGWAVRKAGSKTVIRSGMHAFKACPVLAFTEDGGEFPVIGAYSQIATLSRRAFNVRSEQDDLMRSQTFNLLTMHVPPEAMDAFEQVKGKVSATIGTHSMLMYPGERPGFIAPESGPAETYSQKLEELQNSIRRIAKEENVEAGAQAESGVARRMRFEQLNAEIATFAQNLQQLERRMWALFRNALPAGGAAAVAVTWPTDYNLADVEAELAILEGMQRTGFPPEVLNEKRKAIAATEFDSADDSTKAALARAIDDYESPLGDDPGGGPDPLDPDTK